MSTTIDTPTRGSFSLDARYLAEDGAVYLTGVQALVRALLDRSRHDQREGHRGSLYVTGYEGSPLAGYDLEIQRRSRLMEDHGVVHAPALNEELAATALVGTQLAGQVAELTTDGVTGFWYGKAPGLDRATDAIRHAANAISEFPELSRLHFELWDMANDIAVELDRAQGGADA